MTTIKKIIEEFDKMRFISNSQSGEIKQFISQKVKEAYDEGESNGHKMGWESGRKKLKGEIEGWLKRELKGVDTIGKCHEEIFQDFEDLII